MLNEGDVGPIVEHVLVDEVEAHGAIDKRGAEHSGRPDGVVDRDAVEGGMVEVQVAYSSRGGSEGNGCWEQAKNATIFQVEPEGFLVAVH